MQPKRRLGNCSYSSYSIHKFGFLAFGYLYCCMTLQSQKKTRRSNAKRWDGIRKPSNRFTKQPEILSERRDLVCDSEGGGAGISGGGDGTTDDEVVAHRREWLLQVWRSSTGHLRRLRRALCQELLSETSDRRLAEWISLLEPKPQHRPFLRAWRAALGRWLGWQATPTYQWRAELSRQGSSES